MSIEIIAAPVAWPVTLAEAKLSLRVTRTSEDTEIQDAIETATEHIEKITGRSIATRTLRLSIPGFCDRIELPRCPVKSIESFVYDDADGLEQEVSAALYEEDLTEFSSALVRLSGQSWPETADTVKPIRIEYIAGYVEVPKPLKRAIKLMIGDLYLFRETATTMGNPAKIPTSAQIEDLITNFRDW